MFWAAYGKNLSDDSRCGPPFIGYFQGERQDVIDWIALTSPDFPKELKERYGAELREIQPNFITRDKVQEAAAALANKRQAEERVQRAFGKVLS